MALGARSPEDLDSLFEDAYVLRDRDVLADLFEVRAALVLDDREVRGDEAVARAVAEMWTAGRAYYCGPRRIVQVAEVALTLGGETIGLMRRGRDGTWRYVVSVLGRPSGRAT